jgi:hypothetical protein
MYVQHKGHLRSKYKKNAFFNVLSLHNVAAGKGR